LRDLKLLTRLERECFEDDRWPLIDLFGVLTSPGIVRLKAVVDGQMVGFIAGERNQEDGAGWIITLGVRPSFRRQGMAVALLEACEHSLDMPRLRLCVRQDNFAAIQLYMNNGYQKIKTWKKYYSGGQDALVFEKYADNQTTG
jgi:ribosomal protein S18 acetylase RimI-like enzyme